MRGQRFPITYGECRARFREAAAITGVPTTPYPISARGPHDEQLTIDVARLGDERAERALLVLAGVHGVEGLACSALMCDALARWGEARLPDATTILLVHGVNPWGMAWWRRQNESNVDLNRNWDRDRRTPAPNAGYAELHPLLCPDGHEPPSDESLLARTRELIRERGYAWVKTAVSEGQFSHPDGLYFGGDRTEASTRLLAGIVADHLAEAREVLTVDLHTGHGEYGTVTLLSQPAPGSDDDRWIRERFAGVTVETTTAADATTPPKRGLLSAGIAEILPDATCRAVTTELGTVDDTTMILAERAEHWVHHHGDRGDPEHAAIVRHHRRCSTPDDPDWERTALAHGRQVLELAAAAAVEPRE